MSIQKRFTGEMMTCVMCGKKEQSDPRVNTQWRCIEVDDVFYYACPDEFPEDRTATKWDYARAYDRVLRHIAKVWGTS